MLARRHGPSAGALGKRSLLSTFRLQVPVAFHVPCHLLCLGRLLDCLSESRSSRSVPFCVPRSLRRSNSSRSNWVSMAFAPTDTSVARSIWISSSMVASRSNMPARLRETAFRVGGPTLDRRASVGFCLTQHQKKRMDRRWTDKRLLGFLAQVKQDVLHGTCEIEISRFVRGGFSTSCHFSKLRPRKRSSLFSSAFFLDSGTSNFFRRDPMLSQALSS